MAATIHGGSIRCAEVIMSEAHDGSSSDAQRDRMTEEERHLFERLADRYEGEPLGDAFEIALQSSDDKEETI